MPRTYDEFANNIRTLANQGKELKLQKLQVMVDLLENHKPLWSKTYDTVADVLKNERWETYAYYTKFRKGSQLLDKRTVNKVGPEVTCLLSTYGTRERNQILSRILDWIDRQSVPPHYQLVATYAKGILPPKAKKLTKRDRDLIKMTQYAGELQKLLRSNGIKFPAAPQL